MVYFTVYYSLVKWFESRGSNFSSAKFAAGCGLTAATFINFVAVAGIIQFAHGPQVVNWLADHKAVSWGAAAIIAVIHWWIGRTIESPAYSSLSQNSELTEPGKYLWMWYVVPTFVLWIVASAIAIASVSPY